MGFLERFLLTMKTFLLSKFQRSRDKKSVDPKIIRLKALYGKQDPPLLINMQVEASFCTAIFTLFKNVYAVRKLLEETVCNPNQLLAEKYCAKLFMTGFDAETKTLYSALSYDSLRNEIVNAGEEHQHREWQIEQQLHHLDAFLERLSTDPFYKIEKVITMLKVLYDVCCFPYEETISLFYPSFQPEYKVASPDMQAVPLNSLKTFLTDFYYLTANFTVTKSLAFALVALYELWPLRGSQANLIVKHLKLINGMLKRTLSPPTLLGLYRILCDDSNVILPARTDKNDALALFITDVSESFKRTQKRIQYDLLDEKMLPLVNETFGDNALESIVGYNKKVSDTLTAICAYSFFWVTPLEILNTFLKHHFTEDTRKFLEMLCLEGLFWNNSYHSNLAKLVGQCSRAHERIVKLERGFSARGGRYYEIFDLVNNLGTLRAAVSPEHMTGLVEEANNEAQTIVQEEFTHFFNLLSRVTDLIHDADRFEPSFVSNIKALLSSRENNSRWVRLKEGMPGWAHSLDFMKAYATAGGQT
jgi:hypothetical protein